jgi:type II secretory pathway pseudopilin PulG
METRPFILKRILRNTPGLTLLEVLLAAGIITTLAIVVFVAVKPQQQLARSRNLQRRSNLHAFMNAIQLRMAENRGAWSATCGTSTIVIPSSSPVFVGSATGSVNLEPCLVPQYMAGMLFDPTTSTPTSTGYTIVQDTNGHITLGAPSAELGETVSVTR